MKLEEIVGKNIKKVRMERDMSRHQLFKRSGVQPVSLSGIESGKKSITLRTLRRLASAMGVEPDTLLRPSKEDLETPTLFAGKVQS